MATSKNVGMACTPLEVVRNESRQRNDSVPSALISVSRQRDEAHVLRKVAPIKLSHLLVRPEQAPVRKEAAQPQVGIVISYFLQYRLNVFKGLV